MRNVWPSKLVYYDDENRLFSCGMIKTSESLIIVAYTHTYIHTLPFEYNVIPVVHAVLTIALNCSGNALLTLDLYSHVYHFSWLLIFTLWPM